MAANYGKSNSQIIAAIDESKLWRVKMSNKRLEIKKAKLRKRQRAFKENGGTGNSKYALKVKARRAKLREESK